MLCFHANVRKISVSLYPLLYSGLFKCKFNVHFIIFFSCLKAAQKHVEKTLKDMMDQKNKLAYENGRFQTQVEQMSLELEGLRKADLECTQYKQLAEALQSKYSQVI